MVSHLVELLMRFPARISFFLLCCGLAGGCSEGVGRKVEATVLSVHGSVVFGIDEQADFRPIAPERRLPDGSCVRGKVYASHGAQPAVAIGAGYFRRWPSARLETIAATEDATAQIDVVDSLEIGDQLRELQSDWQDRRPF